MVITCGFIKNYSVELTNKMKLVIEFIIPKFIEDSTCFERHTAHHQKLQTIFIYPFGHRPLPRLCNGLSPYGLINQRLQLQFRAPDD
jgi:hypothetical protein